MTSDTAINKRTLGNTNIEITPIGLGVMEFSGGAGIYGKMYPFLSQDEKNAIVKAALDGGINWFDTAELYGFGRSERALATALKAADMPDDKIIIATKWLPILRTAGNIPRTITDRLRNLDGYTIDLYMVHQPWGFSSPEAEMYAMADLVEANKIRSVGVSNFDADRMQRAYDTLKERGLSLAVNQVEYSLMNRKIETNGTMDKAKELGVTIIAYTPLGSGLLTGKYHKNPELLKEKGFARRMMLGRNIDRTRILIDALDEIAFEHDATPAQVALNWVINFQGEIVVTIPGATQVTHAEENAAAMRFQLSEEQMTRLDELSWEFR
jgi:aryl-alcohol dehydrogenase-like predicted oxidoreductase